MFLGVTWRRRSSGSCLPPPPIAQGNRHGPLGVGLADDVAVQLGDDLAGGQLGLGFRHGNTSTGSFLSPKHEYRTVDSDREIQCYFEKELAHAERASKGVRRVYMSVLVLGIHRLRCCVRLHTCSEYSRPADQVGFLTLGSARCQARTQSLDHYLHRCETGTMWAIQPDAVGMLGLHRRMPALEQQAIPFQGRRDRRPLR